MLNRRSLFGLALVPVAPAAPTRFDALARSEERYAGLWVKMLYPEVVMQLEALNVSATFDVIKKAMEASPAEYQAMLEKWAIGPVKMPLPTLRWKRNDAS